MQPIFKLLRTTLAGGILFLVPIVILAVIGDKALMLAHKIVSPLAAQLPIKSILGLAAPKFLALGLLLLICFLAGIFARTSVAKKLINWLETSLLSNLPGYGFMKEIGGSLLGIESRPPDEVILARLEDAWQLAFVIERIETGYWAVFVPNAPNPHSGSVYFLTQERIKPVNIPFPSALKCLKRLGAGSNALLKDHLPVLEKANPASHPGKEAI